MELTLLIVCFLLLTILGIFIFNYKLDITMLNIAYLITGIAFFSIVLLMFTYTTHTGCNLINYNNITLQFLQDTCYQYINF